MWWRGRGGSAGRETGRGSVSRSMRPKCANILSSRSFPSAYFSPTEVSGIGKLKESSLDADVGDSNLPRSFVYRDYRGGPRGYYAAFRDLRAELGGGGA